MQQKYSAGLVSQMFWFVELKQVIQLIQDGQTAEAIRVRCVGENLFGAAKEYRAKEIYRAVWRRAGHLEPALQQLFLSSDVTTQKLIALIAILRDNSLLLEFLYDVYQEAVILGTQTLSTTDVLRFFERRELDNASIASWTPQTRRRLASSYLNFLTDANLLTPSGRQRLITPPIISVALQDYLESHHEKHLLTALTGGRL